MTRRCLPIGALLVAATVALGGCLLNTPTNVAKRFVGTIKRLQWDKMEALVDWTATERALKRKLTGKHREILNQVAEEISSYEISYFGEERAKSNFVFFRVTKAESLERTDDLARMRITLNLTSDKTQTFELTTTKVGRTWRVVLTPNLLKMKRIDY